MEEALSAGAGDFDEVWLLNDQGPAAASEFQKRCKAGCSVVIRDASLRSPVDYGEIHGRAVEGVEAARAKHGAGIRLSFFLNSGTPPMGSVWLLLGKSRFPANLVAWSRDKKLERIEVPFDISAEFVPGLLASRDAALEKWSPEVPSAGAAFQDIIFSCKVMRSLVRRAQAVARHSVPVLLEGESGTGKELLARAIHNASPRAGRPFIAVNCGAIPENLVEAELFGHVKGAFTGATEPRLGHFRAAEGGTLFLDEVGELSLSVQVKLLRPLQEGEVTPVGASRPERVNVRVIAATHRNLLSDVAQQRFREDLFFRLAIAVLRIPPLREREGDLTRLVDSLWTAINRELVESGFGEKRLSPGARNQLLRHQWPGNVRELLNTLRRAALWAEGATVTEADAREALLPEARAASESVLHRPLLQGFELEAVLAEVARHYLARALEEAGGNKTKAAWLLGFKSHQRFTQWCHRYSR
ncbi:sigma-54 interaction domain-containing protein [Pyxidicoccus sp. 3LFB2]